MAAALRADPAPISTGVLDLTTARTEALAQSPVLRRLDALADAEDWQRWAVLSDRLPHINLAAEHLVDAEYPGLKVVFGGSTVAFPGAFPQDTVDLSLHWTLFDGFLGLERWRAAVLRHDAALLERHRAADEVLGQVGIRFYHALAAAQLKQVADQNVATLRDHLGLAQANEDSGNSTHVDVLRIQAQIEEASADAEQTADQADQARLELAQAMGLSSDARSLDGVLPVPDPTLSVDDWTVDLEGREDLRAQHERSQALERQADGADGAWWPQLYVFGLHEWYRYGAFDPVILPSNGFGTMITAGVGATWDLFNGGADLAKRGGARDQAASAIEALASQRLQVQRDFADWKHRYHYSVRLYLARQRSVEEYQESVRLAQLGFKAGTQTSTEVLDAETDLFRARAGLVQAQADAAEARIQLELARGGEL
jgi:outer membrane protein TolC